ncbi:MAG: hypothetical protein KBC38_01165 [Candidatus Pacebacteria bacterium]|nr:hypothetical protein [Candidatus Paceibacterota bacterium]MBP9840245.1 hypothetical protein [Candidatus Paceibacterota bacterium]
MTESYAEHEELARTLLEPALRTEYARPYDDYRVNIVAGALGWLLIAAGTVFYGRRPSYEKFKAIEVIARVPYQSWEIATYTLLTLFYTNEKRAMELAKTRAFCRMAQDNETMHVVVLSQLVRKYRCAGVVRHTVIPFLFAFFYFVATFLIYLFSRKTAHELNYAFERHAYEEYSRFLEQNEETLKDRPIMSEFLDFYGRNVRSEYEFFELVRNDELIHRNRSLRELSDF